MIPPSFIQDLLSRVDIVEVIGRHVSLRKGGANLMGLCPFHGEKSPSFSVSPSKQFYYCFGCGASGNAIGFLTEYLGLGFVEAVQELAQQAGLSVPQEERSPQDRERAQAERQRQIGLSEALARAAEHYRRQLKASPRAIDYLKGRGLTGEIAARFGIGFAPAGWRSLAGVFAHYDDPKLEEAGLVIRHEPEAGETGDGKRYDRFRDRVMFPIRSVQGEVIGFGGRVLDQGEPKYLNSPETPVFSKGRELYGLYEARTAIRQRGHVLVVEGYMDVVALAQSGFGHAVATLGTACTAEHVQKLFRFTDSVVFSFDGDAAGRRAAGRALEAALPHLSDTRSVRFLFLPPEHDPDSYVRALGAEAFERCVEAAVPLSRQLLEQARDGIDMGPAEGRARFLAQARPLWSALPDGALKRQLLREIAGAGGLEAAELAELWQGQPARGPRAGTAGRAAGADDGGPGARPGRGRADRGAMARPMARRAPSSPADHAVRLLLLHSAWWDALSPDDQALLHALPPPHGAVIGWLERLLTNQGPLSWAALEQALAADRESLPDWPPMPATALEDETRFEDLRRVLDGLWVERLADEQRRLIERAAVDPQALQRWREVTRQREALLKALQPVAGG
ncbi:DNA primase [Piscinibacter sakaiensis]|uniref:DNA primase n=1 Tax=Piscinibacter sakaiensis TaxID=1547922 RepID=A0A0K8NXE6_PISS1|nr:DNA primase [Piscinibacter sakaiensis]GAP34600.1 DNA primase [Piscinibacter sakaiensis]